MEGYLTELLFGTLNANSLGVGHPGGWGHCPLMEVETLKYVIEQVLLYNF